MNSEANLLGLLVVLNPLHLGFRWTVVMEDYQQITDLHVRGICHLHR
ncbi:MAG: hypothetical protein ABSG53_09730 [Thermoguttaceae bacterium]